MLSTYKSRQIPLLLTILLFIGTAITSAHGQTIFGRISGTVRDSQGGVVPSAAVTITNEANSLARTATTDSDGFYTVTNLPVGTYTVLIARDGFKKAVQPGVVLAADARLTVPASG